MIFFNHGITDKHLLKWSKVATYTTKRSLGGCANTPKRQKGILIFCEPLGKRRNDSNVWANIAHTLQSGNKCRFIVKFSSSSFRFYHPIRINTCSLNLITSHVDVGLRHSWWCDVMLLSEYRISREEHYLFVFPTPTSIKIFISN